METFKKLRTFLIIHLDNFRASVLETFYCSSNLRLNIPDPGWDQHINENDVRIVVIIFNLTEEWRGYVFSCLGQVSTVCKN